jgi:hypothetical protein
MAAGKNRLLNKVRKKKKSLFLFILSSLYIYSSNTLLKVARGAL